MIGYDLEADLRSCNHCCGLRCMAGRGGVAAAYLWLGEQVKDRIEMHVLVVETGLTGDRC